MSPTYFASLSPISGPSVDQLPSVPEIKVDSSSPGSTLSSISGRTRSLYNMARKGIEGKFSTSHAPSKRASSNQLSPLSRYLTKFVFQGHTVQFVNVPLSCDSMDISESSSSHKFGTWLKDENGNFSITRKLFGKAPWRRKESESSWSSVASSVRQVLQGPTPPVTPMAIDSSQSMLPFQSILTQGSS